MKYANSAVAELDATIETLVRIHEVKATNHSSMLCSTFRKTLEKQAYLDYRLSRDIYESKGMTRDHPLRRQILRTAAAVCKRTVCGESRKAYEFVIQQAADTLIEKMKQGDKEQ